MADVQIAIIDQQDTQIALTAPAETEVNIAVPGVQGPVGPGVPGGGTANQVLFKQSGTNYDTAWGAVTSAMIADGAIVNADVNASAAIDYSKLALSSGIVNTDISASAAIAGTKVSPNFGSQNTATTGTSTAASFIPSSSTVPTNGLYLPAANSVALATGGSGRLLVDSTGQIGIGILSPRATLDVASASHTALYAGGTGNYSLRLGHNNTDAQITSINVGTAYTNLTLNSLNTVFATGSSAAAERLRITSAGALNFVGAGTAGSTQAVSFNGSAPVNSLVIDSSGRLGVGTSSPTQKISIDGAGATLAGTAAISLFDGNSAASRRWSISNGAGGNAIDLFGKLVFSYGSSVSADPMTGTAAAVIDSSGRVGIGTTSPSVSLDVVGQIKTSLLFDINGEGFIRGDAAGELRIQGGTSGTVFRNNANNTEQARIDGSGRLLVGTSSADGTASNSAAVVAGRFQSFNGSDTFTTAVAKTLFTAPNSNATYIVTLRRGSVGDATNYEAVSILSTNAGGSVSAVLTSLKTAALVSITMSGSDVQGTQTSGGNASLQWVVTRVG